MAEFIVHGVPGSPYVRAALIGLEEKGADYRIERLDPMAAKAPEHLARHAFGRMPVLEHGDFRLYETQAILRYLDRIIPAPPLIPTDARAEARMNQMIGITDCYVMHDISAPIVFQRAVAPRFGIPVNEERLAAALPRAKVCIDEIARLLGEQPYVAGDAVSLADLILAAHLGFEPQVEEVRAMLAPHPHLRAWRERMNARPSLQATTTERLYAGA
ncbi:MAG TPA: glutathione S-transferase family protein [Caulobacteraceae bacterium]|jgi:glutathione S-transferase|nr:glutathione S-transferase family protein [Caulobacteraceae bacterium]